ncbi:MAG TPA: peroxiredoxin, partial [Cellulomonas sp.]
APDFTLPTADGGSITLSDLRGAHVVVYFYPAAGTPGCTKQACDFRDSLASLQSHGYRVVGVSPDAPAALAAFAETEALTFPLASDPERAVLEAWGAWGGKTLYGKTVTGVIRSTVVVGPDGVVELARYNVKATGHVAKLRRDLGID